MIQLIPMWIWPKIKNQEKPVWKYLKIKRTKKKNYKLNIINSILKIYRIVVILNLQIKRLRAVNICLSWIKNNQKPWTPSRANILVVILEDGQFPEMEI